MTLKQTKEAFVAGMKIGWSLGFGRGMYYNFKQLAPDQEDIDEHWYKYIEDNPKLSKRDILVKKLNNKTMKEITYTIKEINTDKVFTVDATSFDKACDKADEMFAASGNLPKERDYVLVK